MDKGNILVAVFIVAVFGFIIFNGGGGGAPTVNGTVINPLLIYVDGKILTNGTVGAQGPQGIQGIQGVQGLQGNQGDTGLQGNPGDQGIQGIQGIQGVPGVNGVNGTQGIQGVPGTNGEDGTNGENGTNGEDGAPGALWYTGSGAPGSGTGINGDLYLNTANGDVYTKSGGTWSVTGNIKGATGNTGATGPSGATAPIYTQYNLAKCFPFGGAPTTLTATNHAANVARIFLFELDRNVTVTAVTIRTNAALSNCLILGIFNSAGTQVWQSGVLSTVATNTVAVTANLPVTLPAGTYYFATTNNNVVSTTAAYSVSPAVGAAGYPRWGTVATTNGAMPGSITPSGITETTGGWMCYVTLSAVTT